MDKNNINISKVETYLNKILDNVVSMNTFFGSYPEKETIDPKWNDMVFVEIPNGIEDVDAYGVGTVLVWLFARPLSSGRKNVGQLSRMEIKLNEVIEKSNDSIYHISRRETYTDYDRNLRWHCNVVELIIKVF